MTSNYNVSGKDEIVFYNANLVQLQRSSVLQICVSCETVVGRKAWLQKNQLKTCWRLNHTSACKQIILRLANLDSNNWTKKLQTSV